MQAVTTIGLDIAKSVFQVHGDDCNGQVVIRRQFAGSHVNRTARLEPNTPPGEVYVKEAFAALVTLLEECDFLCEYVGMMKTPKNHGRLRTYLLRRRAKGDLARQIGIIGG